MNIYTWRIQERTNFHSDEEAKEGEEELLTYLGQELYVPDSETTKKKSVQLENRKLEHFNQDQNLEPPPISWFPFQHGGPRRNVWGLSGLHRPTKIDKITF